MWYINRTYMKDGWYGQLLLLGFAFHKGPGQYSKGHNLGLWKWKIWSAFDKFGYSFMYKGDEIYWVWPWRRKSYKPDTKFISLLLNEDFESLKSIDDRWDEINKRLTFTK
jgi:hypothetical protein